jgi:DNA-binding Xre family transcriptional regulator
MTVNFFKKYSNLVDNHLMTKEEIEITKKSFGKRLQFLRERKGLSLLKMSYNCSIDESKISKIEKGKFNITISTLLELAKGLEVEPKELLDF